MRFFRKDRSKEGRGERPDTPRPMSPEGQTIKDGEIKNQEVAAKNKVLTEKIPENLMDEIKKIGTTKQGTLNQLLQLTIHLLNAQRQQQELLTKLKNTEQKVQNTINYVARKMKLTKKKEYSWRFDGRDSFIGVLQKPKKKRPKINWPSDPERVKETDIK